MHRLDLSRNATGATTAVDRDEHETPVAVSPSRVAIARAVPRLQVEHHGRPAHTVERDVHAHLVPDMNRFVEPDALDRDRDAAPLHASGRGASGG